LLDEATSALDSKNEKKVQDTLDQIMMNKTSISIAHRLDTIKNSKIIYVFDKGRVAELGNYEDLMDRKGYFYNLEKGI
jgi:ABC-type multidrug transport system fused ATPase/permease subunit